LVTHWKS